MKCPVCSEQLQMTERKQVELDYCPKCRGIWLDRGELDQIISRVQRESQGQPKPHYSERFPKNRQEKRSSFIRELFDFD